MRPVTRAPEPTGPDGIVGSMQRLTDTMTAAVGGLVAAATATDGVAPLGEHVLLHLRDGGDTRSRHLFVRDPARPDQLLAYAHLDPTDPVDGAIAELVVHPDHRGTGLGTTLLTATVRAAGSLGCDSVRIWAHGALPAATALATHLGFTKHRTLWSMRRPLGPDAEPLPPVTWPAGVDVRTFTEADTDAVLAVNARAFADLPDQGGWTAADIRARTAEPWFDPAGFFLAREGGKLLGFHWTKVHGSNQHASNQHGADQHAHPPIGEVYVVGVDPAAQGRGLGKALTLVGLHHLQAEGLDEVMLYVDGENAGAIALYERLGFTRHSLDIQFIRTTHH